MNPAGVRMGWRDKEIIPHYNRAGIRKFAFVMPVIGAGPAPEGPAEFPTAYFSEPEGAYQWLDSGN